MRLLYIIGILFSLISPSIMASTNESSPFLVFDNNVSAGLALISSPGNYWASNLNANGQALFNNGLWLDLFATTKLSFNFNNNSNNNISKTYNNSSGSSFGINVGYAFLIANNYNLIPHIGLSYANQLLAVNQNSIQQFIIEDPSYNVAFGVKNEMILIPSVLKASIDLAFNIGDHSSVVPNSVDGSLGHYDYTLYTVKVIPSIQWNITERFAMIGYYQFNYNFSNSMSSPNVEYPDIGVSSNQFLMNNYVQNTLGINFAVLF